MTGFATTPTPVLKTIRGNLLAQLGER